MRPSENVGAAVDLRPEYSPVSPVNPVWASTVAAGALAASASGEASASSSSETSHPSEWDISQVVQWLQTLQPATVAQSHSGKFREHEIDGDVLLELDAEALKEMGVTSVGHRLVILRAIYDLKKRHNVELDADAWRPDVPSSEGYRGSNGSAASSSGYSGLSGTLASVPMASMVRALQERDERVWSLEQEVARLVDWLIRYTEDSASTNRNVESLRSYLPPAKAHSSLPFHVASGSRGATPRGGTASGTSATASNGLGHTATGSSADTENMSLASRGGNKTPVTTTAFRSVHDNQGYSPYGAPGNVSQVGYSPTSSTPGATPTQAHPPPLSIANDAQKASSVFPGATLMPGSAAGSGGASSAANSSLHTPTNLGVGTAATLSPSSPFSVSGTLDGGSGSGRERGGGGSSSGGGSGGDTPYKSFRVTLDDPCYKVLPAALKKYKINDDWRQYALFICYGTTERCLSYDEKPLLLFQKLKENKQNPVFMLRHIRDVKSPIAIANAKAAARKATLAAQGATSPAHRSGVGKVADVVAKFGGGSGKDGAGGEGGAGASGGGGGAGDRAGEAYVDSSPGHPRLTGPAAQLAEGKTADAGRGTAAAASASGSDTYAISIYPYVSERDDEFDVSVGDTFIVKSKAKGWWVVQRDTRARGYPVVEGVVRNADGTPRNGGEIRSGWVPAGCLLETRKPLSSIVAVPNSKNGSSADPDPASPASPTTPQPGTRMADAQSKALAEHMANVPIPPSLITSTSTPGVVLMDYNNDDDGLHLSKGERLRVFKRYNHWSYCVIESEPHTRGWLPSWHVSRGSRSASASASAAPAASASSAA